MGGFGTLEKFRQHMYIAGNEEGLREYSANPQLARVFALKPMNCPCHVQIYKQSVKSYRDLPLRMAEFGSCHRAEPLRRLARPDAGASFCPR